MRVRARRDLGRDLRRLGPRKLVVLAVVGAGASIVATTGTRIASSVAFTVLGLGIAAVGFLLMEQWRTTIALADAIERATVTPPPSTTFGGGPDEPLAPRRAHELGAAQLHQLHTCGFTSLARAGLEQRRFLPGLSSHERARSFFELARAVADDDPDRALELARVARLFIERPGRHHWLFEADVLQQLGRHDEAAAWCQAGLDSAPGDLELLLRRAAARSSHEPSAGLHVLNELWRAASLESLELDHHDRVPAIERLRCARDEHHQRSGGPLVSVIVPVFNAAASLPWSLRSLQEQTWAELEIIVVDDASSDGSAEIAADAARLDPRVRLVRRADNGGAYVARNEGLRHARGHYLLVHDADDWIHPQLIERCLEPLVDHPELVGVAYHQLRVDPQLVASVRVPGTSLVRTSSTPLLQRWVLDQLGCWDTTRIAADTELDHRIRRAFGPQVVGALSPAVPMRLALERPGSLTADPASGTRHWRRASHPRRLYQRCYESWHAEATSSADLRLEGTSPSRAFPCPVSMLPHDASSVRSADVVLVTDLTCGVRAERLRELAGHAGAAGALGVVHHPHPMTALAAFHPVSLRSLSQPNVHLLATGDHIEAKLVIVDVPDALHHDLDGLPELRAPIALVSAYRLEPALEPDAIEGWDAATVQARLRSWLGADVVWCAHSTETRRRLDHLVAVADHHLLSIDGGQSGLVQLALEAVRRQGQRPALHL